MTVVTCSASDARGNLSTRTFPVAVRDTTVPSIQITSPARDAMLSGTTVTVIVQTTDAVGVSGVTVNSAAASMTSGTAQSGSWRATVPLSLEASGELRLDVRASDGRTIGTAVLVVDLDGIPCAMNGAASTG